MIGDETVADQDDDEGGDQWGLAHRGPFRDGRVHVLSGKCATCIFRPGNLMRLAPGRVKEMVDGCVEGGGVIPCHSTLGTDSPAVCRGFFDGYADRILALRLAGVMEMLEFDPVPEKLGGGR